MEEKAKDSTSSKRSKIWVYFELLEKDNENKIFTRCKVNNCKEKLLFHNSTTAMIKHVESQHPEKFKEFQGKGSKTSNTQLTMNSEELKFKELGADKNKYITEAIAKFICLDMRPINIIEGQGFVQMIRILEPRYKIPARSTFSDNIIPLMYEKVKEKIRDKLSSVERCAFTFDYWRSAACKSYLTLTCHYINKMFLLREYVLSTIEVPESHTGLHTSKVILSILEDYKFKDKESSKFYAVTDSASNMKCAAKYLKWPHIECFAHALHNTLCRAFKTTEGLIEKCGKLVKYFRSSAQHSNLLLEMQKKLHKPLIKLKLNVATRWNSTFDMVSRIIDNKIVLVNLALEIKDVNELIFSTEEWEEIISLKDTLSPFYIITKLLCTACLPSISLLRPLILNIQENLLQISPEDKRTIKLMKTDMKKDFQTRMHQYDDVEKLLDLSSLLDPRFKDLYFLSKEKKDHVYINLKEKYEEYSLLYPIDRGGHD